MSEDTEGQITRMIPVQVPDEKQENPEGIRLCSLRETPSRFFASNVYGQRLELINLLDNKWVSGTILHYHFFDGDNDGQFVQDKSGTTSWGTWIGKEAQKNVVREGFKIWSDVGIGIQFKEVFERTEAEIRIGFMLGDGSWSFLGRVILEQGPNERTMNFGWDLRGSTGLDTVLHEIGHTLGFPHEHQNPKAGIVWNEEAVYEALAQSPNCWDRQKTFSNIIRKLPSNEVEGTVWDPDSIMHYPFEGGLIKQPEKYASGLKPAGGLSEKDKSWARKLYPQVQEIEVVGASLTPSKSILLNLSAGEQRNLSVFPEETRYYNFQTFGTSDAVMVLFEEENGELRYRTGDDDSGRDSNANFKIKLFKGHKYVLRIRMYYVDRPRETAVMMW